MKHHSIVLHHLPICTLCILCLHPLVCVCVWVYVYVSAQHPRNSPDRASIGRGNRPKPQQQTNAEETP